MKKTRVNENPYSHTFSYADLHTEKYGKKKIYRLWEKGKFNKSIGSIIYMDLPPNTGGIICGSEVARDNFLHHGLMYDTCTRFQSFTFKQHLTNIQLPTPDYCGNRFFYFFLEKP